MNERFKRFVVFICIFCILSLSLRPQPSYAVVGVDDALVLGGAGATVTIGSGALIALIGTSLVAGGVMLDSTANDGYVCKYIASKMIEGGNVAQSVGVTVSDAGKSFLTWTDQGLSSFGSIVHDVISSGIPLSKDYSIGSYYLSVDSVVSVPVTYFGTTTGIETFKISQAGYYSISISGNTGSYYFDCKMSSGVGIESGPYKSIDNYSINLGSASGSSVCVPLPSSYNDYNLNNDVIGSDVTAQDGSVSYQPKVGMPLTSTGTGDSVVLSPDVSIPYGKSWGDISSDLGITYPQSTDTYIDTPVDSTGSIDISTGVMNIPILGDILKVLLNILQFLKDLIGNFITALVTALRDLAKELFIPDTNILVNEFTAVKSKVETKFPVNLSLLTSVSDTSSNEPNFVYHFTILGVYCTLDISFIKRIVPYSQMVANGLVAIFLVWYNYRKIIWIIRGTVPFSGDGHSGGTPGLVPTSEVNSAINDMLNRR